MHEYGHILKGSILNVALNMLMKKAVTRKNSIKANKLAIELRNLKSPTSERKGMGKGKEEYK
ncbi:hypothetical protein L484_008138 [Morus notabilis]|uniref:Uncharacterized protein n=1 Tax=Morus notabilis TaxID=981085 RepID=W9RMV0_9ROSA|nr:hypothetical protein L484_008138 [Morus notabilis]